MAHIAPRRLPHRGHSRRHRPRKAKGKTLACAQGCSACCRAHTTIPVHPLEWVDTSWLATEKIEMPARDKLKAQLRRYGKGTPRPFLVDGICPASAASAPACRHFNVFGRGCSEGEDAYYTRRREVLTPIPNYRDDACFTMPPFYGVQRKNERRKIINSDALHEMARVLPECNWGSVAEKMEEFDQRRW